MKNMKNEISDYFQGFWFHTQNHTRFPRFVLAVFKNFVINNKNHVFYSHPSRRQKREGDILLSCIFSFCLFLHFSHQYPR